jgi:AraC-like DNA-binding protein
MGTRLTTFDRLVADSMRFHCELAMYRTVDAGYTTHWRILPFANVAGLTQGSCVIEYEDRSPLVVRPGMGVCLMAGHNHRITHPETSFSASSHVSFRMFGSLDVLSLVDLPTPLPEACFGRIVDINRQLTAVAQRTGALISDICTHQALGFSLLSVLIEAGRVAPRSLERLRAGQRLAPVLEVIERDLSGVDQTVMCRTAGVSRSRLHEIFHQAFACAPMAFVSQRRLQRARELLAGSDHPISAVAELSGYADQFHFSRLFKKANGLSPTHYRAAFAERRV